MAESMGSVKKDDGSYDISSWYAKGGLVERPAAKAPKAAKKPTNKKKGLGRK